MRGLTGENWDEALGSLDCEVELGSADLGNNPLSGLVEVLDTEIDRVHLHTRLLVQAREWESRGRDHSLLLRGGELKQAETWLADQAGRRPAATPAQAQLILASRRATTRRQRGFGVTAVAMVVALAVLAAVALIQRQIAIQQRHTAITRKLVANSAALSAKGPGDSMLLAVEAFHYQPTRDGRSMFAAFLPAISKDALKARGGVVRRWRLHLRTTSDLAELAEWMNPVIRGWMDYYGKFYRTEMLGLLRRINTYLVRWARRKFKRLRAFKRAKRWWTSLLKRQPGMFVHWAWMPEF